MDGRWLHNAAEPAADAATAVAAAVVAPPIAVGTDDADGTESEASSGNR